MARHEGVKELAAQMDLRLLLFGGAAAGGGKPAQLQVIDRVKLDRWRDFHGELQFQLRGVARTCRDQADFGSANGVQRFFGNDLPGHLDGHAINHGPAYTIAKAVAQNRQRCPALAESRDPGSAAHVSQLPVYLAVYRPGIKGQAINVGQLVYAFVEYAAIVHGE